MATTLIGFLVLFPLLAAALLLVVRGDAARAVVVITAAVLIAAGSILLAVLYLLGSAWQGLVPSELVRTTINYVTLAVDVLIAVYIIAKSIRYKKLLAGVLAFAQLGIIVGFEFTLAHNVTVANDLYIDPLSVIMALIIGIIGTGICIYSLGYMKDHHQHALEHAKVQAADANDNADDKEDDEKPGKSGKLPDRRPVFFALMFLFLSAMYGIVFSNNLSWLLCAWEVTTVCSFALIGYTRTAEAINNSFRQIVMNLAGGLAFAVALAFLAIEGIGELDVVIALGASGSLVVLPIALLAFAGITKAAQVPFQSWLLGAMVAPTPTSALLHSSTMVKAGVFLVIKLAPTFGWNSNGVMVMLIGALTFLFCSAIAVSQSNAKRVLAYSTIANLGLIVACAGVGTPEAVWAAIFLLIFHAAAKSLLFLCVGTAEHHIGSRDIEHMDNLFRRMPTLARLMALGILCMFIAPFGMLISKWATIVSLVHTNNITLLIILAFGSAVTFMFWAKWLGKILAAAQDERDIETTVHRSEWFSLVLMALLVLVLSLGFPFISKFVVVPYLAQVAGIVNPLVNPYWLSVVEVIDFDNLLIMAVIVLAIVLAFAAFFGKSKKRKLPIYLAGVGEDFEKRTFTNSLSKTSEATQRNWYLGGLFGEKALTPMVNTMCIVLLLAGIVMATLNLLWGWSL
ncbi:MAG: hypothetical protein LBS98_05915 [Coriobacteriales bacterium]|nr:hypothetical protein [Coriobacteriales bacterium]